MLKELLAANIDLYVDQGDTYYKKFTIKDNAGTVINLTGMSVQVNIKRYTGSTRNYNATVVISNPTSGEIELSMTEADTSLLVNDRYFYSIKLRSGSDAVRIMSGQLLVSPSADAINSGQTYNSGSYNG